MTVRRLRWSRSALAGHLGWPRADRQGHGVLRGALQIAADLVSDLMDLLLGLLQRGLCLRGPLGSSALSPGWYMAYPLCPSRSLEPAHDPSLLPQPAEVTCRYPHPACLCLDTNGTYIKAGDSLRSSPRARSCVRARRVTDVVSLPRRPHRSRRPGRR